jgi:hypothetical protein
MHHRRRNNNNNNKQQQQHHLLLQENSSSISSIMQTHAEENDVEAAAAATKAGGGTNIMMPSTSATTTTSCFTYTHAGLYVLSGCSQPLIMTLLKQAGIADASCQSYMVSAVNVAVWSVTSGEETLKCMSMQQKFIVVV